MTQTNELYDPTTERVVGLNSWSKESHPAATAQATVTQASAGAGLRNVCRSITASVAAGATAQTPINVVLRDGPTGTGPVLWSGALAAPANGCGVIQQNDLDIQGSFDTEMTLEFTGGGVASSLQTVAMSGTVAK